MNQEDEFNRHGRVKNAGKAMTFNVVATIANRLMAFAYRLVFLHYLSAAYLGITGLFTNIISIRKIRPKAIPGSMMRILPTSL